MIACDSLSTSCSSTSVGTVPIGFRARNESGRGSSTGTSACSYASPSSASRKRTFSELDERGNPYRVITARKLPENANALLHLERRRAHRRRSGDLDRQR